MIPLAIDARRQRYPDEVPYPIFTKVSGDFGDSGLVSPDYRAQVVDFRSRGGDVVP